MTILITGATGHIGGHVARILLDESRSIRVLAKDVSKLPEELRSKSVVGDYADTASMIAAFASIEIAFLISVSAAPGKRAELHDNAFRAARTAGVKHVVYLSLLGAAPDSHYAFSRDHWESEKHLERTGLAHTILRNGKYTEQLLEPEMVGDDDVLRGPATGKISWISRSDSSKTIAAVLTNPPGGIIHYSGPEALTLRETAERLSRGLGKAIRFEETSAASAHALVAAKAEREHKPSWRADLAAGTYRAIAADEYASVNDAASWIGRTETLEQTVRSGALDAMRDR